MIQKIFEGELLGRLDCLKQWSEKNTLHKESVSEHSFKVSVFTKFMLEDIFIYAEKDEKVNNFKSECISYAILHDFDEAFLLRDISHEVKYNIYNGRELCNALSDYVDYVAKEFFELNGVDSNKVGNVLYNDFIMPFCNSPKIKLVKTFVKVADWLALLYNLNIEKELGNNGAWVQERIDYCNKKLSQSIMLLEVLLEQHFDKYKLNFEQIDKIKK
jgi:5'-deoxynucleotidase YfbR-like HD superfamily hydrolase